MPADKEECDHFPLIAFIGLSGAEANAKIQSLVRPVGGRLEFNRSHFGPTGLSLCYLIRPDVQWGLRRVNVATGALDDPPSDLYSYGPTWHPTRADQWIYKGERGLILYDSPYAAGPYKDFGSLVIVVIWPTIPHLETSEV